MFGDIPVSDLPTAIVAAGVPRMQTAADSALSYQRPQAPQCMT
jgi:hypothetical protein